MTSKLDTPLAGPHQPPPRRRRGEQRDAALRARASDLFLEQGYDGVTVDDIIREVGGSKANVYSFYGGKDGLFVSAMDDTLGELVLPLKRLKLDGLSLERGLQKCATTLLRVLLQDRHLAFQRLVIAEALRHPQIAQNWYRNGPAGTHAILEGFLTEQQALGLIRSDVDPGAIAVLFHDMVTRDLLNRAIMAIDGGPNAHQIAATIRTAVGLLIAGIGVQG